MIVCAVVVPKSGSDDFQAAAFNEETLRLLGAFIRAHGSVRLSHEGEGTSASAISDCFCALRAHRSLQADTAYALPALTGDCRRSCDG